MYVVLCHMMVIVLVNFYACLEGYFFLCTLRRVRGQKNSGGIITLIYWFLAIFAAGLYFCIRFSSGSLRSAFSAASSYWGLFIFVPFFLLADILVFGISFYKARAGKTEKGGKFPRAARVQAVYTRPVFDLTVRTASVVLALGTLALGTFSARYAKVTNYALTLEKPLPQTGLKVVFISDIHIGAMVHKKQLARIVSKINTLEADLVLLAGDIIDRNMNAYKSENLNEELGKIKARFGVYAVSGNHDYFEGNLNELEEQLAEAGISLLNDEAVLVNGAFYIAGRNDISSSLRGVARKALPGVTGNLDASLPLIMIDHQPLNLDEAEAAGVDLQISGHTHRGQIWPVSLIVKRIYENSYGLLYKGKSAFVVSSGCGTSGPPVRIGTRSEIVCIDLKNPPGNNGVTRN